MSCLLCFVLLLHEGVCHISTLQLKEKTCNLRRNPGTGNESLERYWYDPVPRECKLFHYRGANGNANNFENKQSCRDYCKDIVPQLCWQLPYEGMPVPGIEPVLRWFYDKSTDTCKEFYFKGLSGMFNKFDNITKCEDMCQVKKIRKSAIPGRTVEIITNPIIPTTSTVRSTTSPITTTVISTTRKTPTLTTTSFTLKTNTRSTVTTKKTTATIRITTTTPETTTTEGGINYTKFPFVKHCLEYPKDGTYCKLQRHIGYYYHAQQNGGDCRQFEFNGCDSTYNHYETLEECRKICVNHNNKSHDIHLYDFPYTYRSYCESPVDSGKLCFKNQRPQHVTRYHYDVKTKKCKPFSYRGCGGFPNKYSSRRDCLTACKDRSKYQEETEVGLGETWPNYIIYRFPE